MKLSEKWLRERVNPRLTTKQLAERLTMAGLEVGAVAPVAPPLERVVVGEIRSLVQHPHAERLTVCEVDAGAAHMYTVVCGAANARVGLKTPLALPGVRLPGGKDISESDIRGVRSQGMLCSAAELGLADSAEGLMSLDRDARPGMPIVRALALDDMTLEIDLTPNRGDCMSVLGVAREVSALTKQPLKPLKMSRVRATTRKRVAVVLDAPRDCPIYIGRVIEGINPKAVTPQWLQERLRRSGQRSIHPVVDVTNYVLLELGQPMHAFDLGTFKGKLHVRRARRNEQLTLLDGRTVRMSPDHLVIADDANALALAGVMGGQDSAVSDATTRLFLEAAHFRPEAIAGRARALGLQTESSQRFERGVDPALPRLAIERATELLLAIVGGKSGPVVEKVSNSHCPSPKPIRLRRARVAQVLGQRLPSAQIRDILGRLGLRPTAVSDGWRVVPPTHRFDLNREIDLIEEIARVHGYERLSPSRARIDMRARPLPEGHVTRARLCTLLADRDYQEVITYSFVDPDQQHHIDPAHPPLRLANPIAANMAVMRTSLWPGLLTTLHYNINRQAERIRIFELGRRFLPEGAELRQEHMLAGAVTGTAYAPQWGMTPPRAVDFHDVKADLEAVLALASGREIRFRQAQHPALHPGITAEILSGVNRIGWIGALHPDVAAKFGLEQPVYLFELQEAAVRSGRVPQYREISRFPAIRRDLAIVVEESRPAETVLKCVENAVGKTLVNLELFDEYRGKGVDSGKKSIALGLTLQDSSRTLKDAEVEEILARVVAELESELGARLR